MQKNLSHIMSYTDIDWSNVKGPIPFRMSNDYLFRSIMQLNNKVLTLLICSLLHLDPKNIRSVLILNPIELGTSLGDKSYILDIKVDLDSHIVTLEMQVINEGNWPERSLCYLCRTFDNLNRGEAYLEVRPATQIDLLDFTLFNDSPEFYATYQLLNIKNHKLYSDKFRISVLELNQVMLATEEDKRYHLDCWARFFKATTWEEIHMIAKKNTDIQEAAATVYHLSQEEKIRQQCEAREDYYRRTSGREKLLRKAILERDEAYTMNHQLNMLIDQLILKNEQLFSKVYQLSSKIQQLSSKVQQLQLLLDEHLIPEQ